MKRRLFMFMPLLFAIAAGSLAGGAAYARSPGEDAYWLLAGGPSLDELVSRYRRRDKGKVLSAETVDEDGRRVHRLRILRDDGRVRRLRFDGDTGAPIERPPPRDWRKRRDRVERYDDFERPGRRPPPRRYAR